jgi:hypothetical protein
MAKSYRYLPRHVNRDNKIINLNKGYRYIAMPTSRCMI